MASQRKAPICQRQIGAFLLPREGFERQMPVAFGRPCPGGVAMAKVYYFFCRQGRIPYS